MIVLASASPRRRELMSLLTPTFDVVVSSVDEHTDIADAPARVEHLARKKAMAVAQLRPQDTVVGADTVVWVSDSARSGGNAQAASHAQSCGQAQACGQVQVDNHVRAGNEPCHAGCTGEILEKPVDLQDARRMMMLLSDTTHTVYTGVCVIHNKQLELAHCATHVTFAPISSEELDKYIATADVLDKAGAYAVQGDAARFVRCINGCFFNAVGFPVHLIYTIFKKIGGIL